MYIMLLLLSDWLLSLCCRWIAKAVLPPEYEATRRWEILDGETAAP